MDESGTAPMGAIQQRRQLLDDAPTLGFECTFDVDDVESVRERILAAGGRILMEKFTISFVGHLIAFEDPGGTRPSPWSTTRPPSERLANPRPAHPLRMRRESVERYRIPSADPAAWENRSVCRSCSASWSALPEQYRAPQLGRDVARDPRDEV